MEEINPILEKTYSQWSLFQIASTILRAACTSHIKKEVNFSHDVFSTTTASKPHDLYQFLFLCQSTAETIAWMVGFLGHLVFSSAQQNPTSPNLPPSVRPSFFTKFHCYTDLPFFFVLASIWIKLFKLNRLWWGAGALVNPIFKPSRPQTQTSKLLSSNIINKQAFNTFKMS